MLHSPYGFQLKTGWLVWPPVSAALSLSPVWQHGPCAGQARWWQEVETAPGETNEIWDFMRLLISVCDTCNNRNADTCTCWGFFPLQLLHVEKSKNKQWPRPHQHRVLSGTLLMQAISTKLWQCRGRYFKCTAPPSPPLNARSDISISPVECCQAQRSKNTSLDILFTKSVGHFWWGGQQRQDSLEVSSHLTINQKQFNGHQH